MLSRVSEPGRLELCTDGGDARWDIDIACFDMVSAIRWCERHNHVYVTAVAKGGRTPDSVHENHRGDLRLFSSSLQSGSWTEVSRQYSHDPVCLANETYAVHRGAGITFIDPAGAVVREVKVGQFNWGTPCLSADPDGTRVVWTRWQGGHKKPRIEDPSTGQSTQFRTSLFKYVWWDSDTLLYYLGDVPRLLNLKDGSTRRWDWRPTPETLARVSGVTKDWMAIAQIPSEQRHESVRELLVLGDYLWFSMHVMVGTWTRPLKSLWGLFRLDRDSNECSLVASIEDPEYFGGISVHRDGSAIVDIKTRDENRRVVAERRVASGPSVGLLEVGWTFAPDSSQPSFHEIGWPTRK